MDTFFRGALSARNIFRASAVLFVLMLGLLGYTFYQANSFDQPQQGGTFREGIVGSIATINPLFAQLNPAEEDIVRLVYSGLTKYDPKQQKIVPDLATFQTSNDYKEYVFRIHPEAKWHDGVPVTADDVVFTYGIIQNPTFSNALLRNAFEGVKVNKIDDKTVQFILPTSYSFFPTATTLGILPKHIWEKIPVEQMASDPLGQKPVGSGPFMIEGALAPSASTEQIVTLARNPNYYGDKPYLDRMILQFYRTFDDLMEKKTSLLGIKSIPYAYVDQIRDMQRFDIYEIDDPRYYAAFMNVENETLQDVRTREGLSLGLDRDALIAAYPFVKLVNSPFLFGADDSWKTGYYPDRAQGSLYDAGWRFPTEDQVNKKKRDLYQQYLSGTVMREQLTSSGTLIAAGSGSTVKPATVGSGTVITDSMLQNATLDGQRLSDIIDAFKKHRVNKDNRELKLHIVSSNVPDYMPAVVADIAAAWDKIGVATEVETIDITSGGTEKLATAIKNRDYDVIILGQELGYNADLFPYWHSSAAKLSGRNLSNFKNATLDKLLASMRKPDFDLSDDDLQKKREEQMTQIAKLLQDEMPAIFLFQQKNYFAVDKKIKNVYIQNLITPKDRFAYAETWYESSGKQLRQEVSFQSFFQWIGKMLTTN